MEHIEYFEIGKIVNTQGTNGDVRVLPTTDEPERFSDLKVALLDNGKTKTEYKIEKVWFNKKFVILKFEGINDMTTADGLRGLSIKIDRKDALPLKENEYYISDLYDMAVYTDEDKYLGIIKDILFTAANDVYIVEDPKDTGVPKKKLLLPAIKECIVNVSVNDNKMIVHMMEGLGE